MSESVRKSRRPRLLPALVALLLLLPVALGAGLFGCTGSSSDDGATTSSLASDQPGNDGTISTDATSTEVDPLDWPMLAPTVIDVPQEEVASALVSSQGGLIEYGPIRLDIPAGALASDTTIVVTRLSGPFHDEPAPTGDGEGVAVVPVSSVYDFGPAGVTFDEPVTLTLPYNPGFGPEGIDPEQIVVAYWNGEHWALAGGRADPASRTVSVQVRAFEGVSVRTVKVAKTLAYAGGPGGWLAVKIAEFIRGPLEESTASDPVLEGKAKDWIAPKSDLVVKEKAAKAVLLNPSTGESKSLDDPDLPDWVADTVKQGGKPTLAYPDADGTVKMATYNDKEGSNWQRPADYFTTGTAEAGPLSGDCTDTTNAAVSVFAAQDFPAKGVYGYGGGGTDKSQAHVWGEVLIGDRVYRIDEAGALITPETDAFNFTEYQPVTDPADPHYNSMWDDQGQSAYDPDWWKPGQFAGTYKGTIPFHGHMGDIPWEWTSSWQFTIDSQGKVNGGYEFATVQSGGSNGNVPLTGVWSFTGQVSKAGKLSGEGPGKTSATVAGRTNTVTGTLTIVGQISGGTFTGTITAEDSISVTATRQ